MLKMSERKIRLQLFAEDQGATDANTETAEKNDNAAAGTGKADEGANGTNEKKYSDADLDKIIGKKFAAWQEKKDKEIEEAKKLEKMSAQEKAEHKNAELQREIDELKREKALSEMSKEARKLLAEKNIAVSDDILARLVSTDATETKAAIDSFAKLFSESVEKAVTERLRGNVPATGTANNNAPISEIAKRIKKYQ